MVLMSAEERVAVRVVGPSDVESARRLCRTIQAGMARQEAAAHLIRLLIHPYFATLILLTSVLLRCALQVRFLDAGQSSWHGLEFMVQVRVHEK